MSVIKVEAGVVVQKWHAKTIDQLKERLPRDDLRESDAVCGQIDNGDGTFRNPPPTPPDPERAIERQFIRDQLAQIPAGPRKRLLLLLFKDKLEERS